MAQASNNELFDIYREDGTSAGQATRAKAHAQGLWHRSSNVYCFDEKERLLIQRRQADKDVWPDAWDLSVAEHLRPGETFHQGALRGLKEELDVESVKLTAIGEVIATRHIEAGKGIFDFEFQQTFRCVYSGPVHPDPAEVAEIKYISLHHLEQDFANRPQHYTPWFRRTARHLGIVKCE
jgi:isopentenyl-diphosphate delta-isomerase